MNNKYVSYIDTDSLFLRLGFFLENQGIDIKKWDALDKSKRIKYLIKLSKYIENDITAIMYDEVQCNDYLSIVDKDDFSIKFKQEIICDNALHISPKMYAFHVINDQGFDVDKIDAKGIETVRSSSPTVFREALQSLLKIILTNGSDDDMKDFIAESIVKFYSAEPENISVNIGVNGISKYLKEDFSFGKGTPFQVKGAIKYHYLLNELNLSHKYEKIHEGDKCKFVYLKKNKWGIEGLTYFIWPKEFKKYGIIPDYDTQIEKYFIGKAKILLEPMNKQELLEVSSNSENDFF